MTVNPRHHRLVPALDAISITQGLDRSSIVILDLLCGEGERLPLLLDVGFQVAAMAPSAEAAGLCLERTHALGQRRVDLRHGDPATLPWPDQSFDIIITGSVSELLSLDCAPSILVELFRLLRPDGLFLGHVAVDPAPRELRHGETSTLIRDLWETVLPRAIHPYWDLPQIGSDPVALMGDNMVTTPHDVLPVRIRRRRFTEYHLAAFRELAPMRLSLPVPGGSRCLRERILQVLPALGYRPLSEPSRELLLVPRHKHEDRMIPLCVYGRHAESLPMIQYRVRGGIIELNVFGPLQADRRSPFLRFELDANALLSPIDPNVIAKGVHAVHRDVAVGVHAMERLLRSSDLFNHRSRELPESAAARLDALMSRAVRRCDLLTILFSALEPFTLYAGHDCYDEAIDVNLSLAHRAEVLVQPKGKLFQFYRTGDPAACWESGHHVFRSHLSQRFAIEVRERWRSLNPQFVADSHALMERRMGSLSALPYMATVAYRDRDSNTSIGWRNFLNLLGLPAHHPALRRDSPQVNWIFCLHSFADEPFRWGMDQLWSLYDMFLEAARTIQSCFPGDLIVLRPHPNSLGYFLNPAVIDKIEAGLIRGPTALLDTYLQLRLCQEIAGLGVECELSQLHPAAELLQPRNSIIVTRHGSIVIEAAWLGRPGIFSCIAPYAFLFDRDCQVADGEGLRRSMQVIRDRQLAATLSFPTHDEIARYQALLDTPLGIKRSSVMGEVPFPTVARRPMQDFDDFRYGPESPHDAAQRLLSCLSAPVERAALVKALGGHLNLPGEQHAPAG